MKKTENFELGTSPIEEIKDARLSKYQLRLFIKRDDCLHFLISGNKWRKLKYNLEAIKKQNKDVVVTMGGAFSNHIFSVAAAGHIWGFQTIGIIRGEKPLLLSPTLRIAQHDFGMKLLFVSRSEYRLSEKMPLLAPILAQPNVYFLPEGGTNEFAVRGCTEIVKEVQSQLEEQINYWCCACGTGGTLAGIIAGASEEDLKTKILGFSVLKGEGLKESVSHLLAEYSHKKQCTWDIFNEYHHGGYARFTPKLIDFINDFKIKHHIALDPIYTGKLFYGIFDLAAKGYFEKNTSILAVHTGGLQGIVGFNERYGELIYDTKTIYKL